MPTVTREDAILFSGGAQGAEAEFGAAAERLGIEEVTFSFAGHKPVRTRGLRVLNHEELHAGEVSLAYVARLMNRRLLLTPHPPYHLLHMRDRRLRQNAVAEVENKRTAGERFENRVNAAVESSAAGTQRQRIEITLHRAANLDRIARKAKIDHPIQTNSIDLDVLDIAFQVAAGAARKPDDLRARYRAPHIGNDSFGRRNAPALKFVRRQDSCPGIEDLHSVDASLELADQIIG